MQEKDVSDGMAIDELDVKVLKALIRDARKSLKDIAKDCGISATAVAKRIDNLKKQGVIKGTKLILGYEKAPIIVALITARAKFAHKSEIIESIKSNIATKYVLNICDQGIGNFDVVIGVLAKKKQEIDEILRFIRGLQGIERVYLSAFLNEPQFTLENLVLQPTGV